jgi:A/G-specific adenine glycosylase
MKISRQAIPLNIVHSKLFAWWRKDGRVLPWRQKIVSSAQPKGSTDSAVLRDQAFHHYFASSLQRDPYRVVVSELMLQQTQVDRVLPKYEAWMNHWPTIEDLASASLQDVFIFWQGLGYNRRARFLWLLAKKIAFEKKGIWPTTERELLELPGIGKYTARAILSFAMGNHVGVVDTNVKRIFDRVWLGTDPSLSSYLSQKDNEYFALADALLPLDKSDPWNQALMDFGARICTAKIPKCDICPLFKECSANLSAQQKGYKNFQELFKKSIEEKKANSKTSTLKKIPFEQTNRYFRGRIMDNLRLGPAAYKTLWKALQNDFGLESEVRFEEILTALEKEKMIVRDNKKIELSQD